MTPEGHKALKDELTRLKAERPKISQEIGTAREHGDRIVFLHSVREGPANQSYGLQVARLAGLPGDVLARARKHLETLEAGAESTGSPQLSLFGNTARRRESEREDRAPSEERVDPVRELLDALDPDDLSPREALDFVYRLIEAGKSSGGSED